MVIWYPEREKIHRYIRRWCVRRLSRATAGFPPVFRRLGTIECHSKSDFVFQRRNCESTRRKSDERRTTKRKIYENLPQKHSPQSRLLQFTQLDVDLSGQIISHRRGIANFLKEKMDQMIDRVNGGVLSNVILKSHRNLQISRKTTGELTCDKGWNFSYDG